MAALKSTSNGTRRVGIIGAGPGGTTLAALLARRGVDAVIFDDGRRPDMVVGESLVPRLVNVFRSLGIEDKVAALGTYKPGVTWYMREGEYLELSFDAMRDVLPPYAYNVPRREFDELIHETAEASGARFVPCSVKLDKQGEGEWARPLLAKETLDLVPEWGGQQPDLLVDASGRRRLFAKLLGLKAAIGERHDVAHFAHYEGCDEPIPAGQTLITRLKYGWCWRIPLRGKLSIGVVVNKDSAKEFGATPEEVLENFIDRTPLLHNACKNRQRVTPVATYANYQLISERGHGPGWVCVGDSFGFVDPMLSPGLCMAMVSAEMLAEAIMDSPSPTIQNRAFEEYIEWFRHMLQSWQNLVNYFYDGRIFALYKTGTQMSTKYPGAFSDMMQRHIEHHIAGMAGGGLTGRAYSHGLLSFLTRYGIRGFNPEDYAILS